MILARAGWRHHLRHPWQAALAILGVALGVAVVVAVELANASSERAFTRSAEALTGQATHRITAGTAGVEESLYTRLRHAGIRPSTPVVEGHVTGPDGPLRVLGIDPWAESGVREAVAGAARAVDAALWLDRDDLVVLFRDDARRLGVTEGDPLAVEVAGREHRLEVAAVVEAPDRLTAEGLRDTVVVDVATAQELLDRLGRLDRIDLVIPEGAAGAVRLARVQELLPDGAVIGEAQEGAAALDEMTAAFRLNLTAFSLLALLVGALLIYNAISFSVVQRRALIGRLRALGVGRGRLFRAVVTEGVVLGIAGTLAGLPLGYLLADGLLELVTRTITDLYFVHNVREVALAPTALFMAAALGVVAAALAAAAPAWEAASVAPRTALDRATLEGRARRWVRPLAGGGLLLGAAGVGLLWGGSGGLVVGFGGVFALLVGAALLVPWAVGGLAGALAGPAGWLLGAPGRMAARGVAAGLSRSGVAAVALVVAVTAVIGVSVMIDSFRGSLATWLDSTLSADVYVSAPSQTGEPPPELPPQLHERLAEVEGVESVATSRQLRVPSEFGEIQLRAFDHGPVGDAGMAYKERGPVAWDRFERGEGAYITEPFAAHHNLEVGDRVAIRTAAGERHLPVLAVVHDYTTSQGAVFVARGFYDEHWQDDAVDGLAVHAGAGIDTDALIAALREATGDEAGVLTFRSDAEIRRLSLDVFDRTFAVTRVLQLLATIVAAVGVFGALLALALERSGEVAVLRALGLTPAQVWTLELARTGLLGAFAGVLAIVPGLALALALTDVINQRAFGWSLQFQVDPAVLAQAVALATVAALLAGLYPAYRAARVPPGEAMREDG
ncbi:ABC transporter permease [Halorhodospira sp. 9622]|uniref:ABC transporter permease n=1 Tax=Halorhodospira sp. 9622 TaxID=2899136 RepID=UPI001EE9A87F|nr:FtsX-like permease family protein [Halorhodospira sp. 9622]